MTGMTRKGVHRRATDARSAVNRLRWEIDLALGEWPNAHTPNQSDYSDVSSAIMELAETAAILHRIVTTIDEKMPEGQRHMVITGDLRERFAWYFEHYKQHHDTPR